MRIECNDSKSGFLNLFKKYVHQLYDRACEHINEDLIFSKNRNSGFVLPMINGPNLIKQRLAFNYNIDYII